MAVVRVRMNQGRPGGRVYLLGQRLHHGFAGLVACAVGLGAMLHDRQDWRRWLTDFLRRER